MPSITQLEYLLAVDKYRHFKQAAKACNVSQPSLSMQLQKMEDELGGSFFDRSKKPILPTMLGNRMIEQARKVLREYSRLESLAKNDEGEISGVFNLAVIPTLAPYLIPLFVSHFAKKHPKLKLYIHEYKTEDLVEALIKDELDAGLLVTPLKDDRLIERTLFYEPFYVFTSSEHKLYKKKTVSVKDLDGSDVWLLDEGHCMRDQIISVCSIKEKQTVLKNVVFQSGGLETLKNLVRKSGGHTLLPYMATLDLSSKEKSTMLKRFARPVPTREVGLVHSRDVLKGEILDCLEQEIIALLPSEVSSLKSKNINIIPLR